MGQGWPRLLWRPPPPQAQPFHNAGALPVPTWTRLTDQGTSNLAWRAGLGVGSPRTKPGAVGAGSSWSGMWNEGDLTPAPGFLSPRLSTSILPGSPPTLSPPSVSASPRPDGTPGGLQRMCPPPPPLTVSGRGRRDPALWGGQGRCHGPKVGNDEALPCSPSSISSPQGDEGPGRAAPADISVRWGKGRARLPHKSIHAAQPQMRAGEGAGKFKIKGVAARPARLLSIPPPPVLGPTAMSLGTANGGDVSLGARAVGSPSGPSRSNTRSPHPAPAPARPLRPPRHSHHQARDDPGHHGGRGARGADPARAEDAAAAVAL